TCPSLGLRGPSPAPADLSLCPGWGWASFSLSSNKRPISGARPNLGPLILRVELPPSPRELPAWHCNTVHLTPLLLAFWVKVGIEGAFKSSLSPSQKSDVAPGGRDWQRDGSQRNLKVQHCLHINSSFAHPTLSSSLILLAPGAFEDCCLAYHRRARLSLLRHAQSYHRQDVSGSCNLPAVIFFLPQKNKMVCGRPGDRWVRAWMKILDARKNSQYHHGTRRNFQVPHSGVRKLSSGTSTLPLSRFSGPTRNNKRKTSLLSTANPAGP
uniref:C-C motif chemokine 25 n=1 Tax=Bos taurus TaxID=9913 RepID=A0AAA9TD41_BOVIN